eukprot:COSAG01_NODE_3641_length_5838_cov_3.651333_4_plen_91_part_00
MSSGGAGVCRVLLSLIRYTLFQNPNLEEGVQALGAGPPARALVPGGSRRAFLPAYGKPGGCLYTQHGSAGNATRRAFARRLPRFVDREQY